MKPTNKLRFIERDAIVSHAQMIVKTTRVLQQWWSETVTEENTYREVGEWRDVPLEKNK